MQIHDDESYFMPVAFGPIRPHTAGVFDDVLTLTVIYRSDHDALATVLPEPFRPGSDPFVYITCQRCRGVNFLAGGNYNLVAVNVAAVFDGDVDHVSGQFALVLWENDVTAIIRGRELLGIPKLFAEISDPLQEADNWHVDVTDNGSKLVDMRLSDIRKLTASEINSMNHSRSDQAWFGWRYFPNVNGVGAALSQPQQIAIESQVARAWQCSGEATFCDVAWEASPMSADIVAGLRTLPLREFVSAHRTEGSVTLTRAKHRVLR